MILLENITKNNLSNLSEIEELRNNNDKYILFCRRILIQGKTGRNQITNWEFLTFLTHIQHTYYYLYEYLTKKDFNGNVLLCCNDYHSSIKFGNLEKEKIIDIWEKPIYKNFRRQLKKKQFVLPICKKCVGLN